MGADFINTCIMGAELELETSPSVFSPKFIDEGTLAMLSQVPFRPGETVLDLGCGYGIVGIIAAKLIGQENVVMSDSDPEAVALSRKNAVRNSVPDIEIIHSYAFRNIDRTGFTLILSNPPYHADFSVPKEFIEKGFNRLRPGGRMYMVTSRLDWYRNKFFSIFGGVTVSETNGYYVFMAEKRSIYYAANKNHKKLYS